MLTESIKSKASSGMSATKSFLGKASGASDIKTGRSLMKSRSNKYGHQDIGKKKMKKGIAKAAVGAAALGVAAIAAKKHMKKRNCKARSGGNQKKYEACMAA